MKSNDELLRQGLSSLSLPCSEEIIERFLLYLHELQKWSRVHNLTSIKEPSEIIRKHFFDSLLFLQTIPLNACHILDIGSGAGFPGLPVKIIRPDLKVTLVEPRRKKASFLRYITNKLKPTLSDVIVVEERVENLKERISGVLYDAAVVRALFSVKEFISSVSSCVKPGGIMAMSKVRHVERELSYLNESERAAVTVTSTKIPGTDMKRYLVVIRKGIEY